MSFLMLFCAACGGTSEKQLAEADKRFAEGVAAKTIFDYTLALNAFTDAARRDTLLGRWSNAQKGFLESADIEARLGLLREALVHLSFARQFTPADAVQDLRFISTESIRLHLLLGEKNEAVARLRSLSPLTESNHIQLATLYAAQDSVDLAERFFLLARNSPKPLIQVQANAGLARLFDGYPTGSKGRDSSEFFLRRIIEIQKSEMAAPPTSDAERTVKYQIGVAASEVLAAFDLHRKDASWFMNKTLGLLTKESNETQRAMLSAEAQSLVTLRAESLARSFDLFSRNEFILGMAYTATLQGVSPDALASERIEKLQQGLELYESILYEPPSEKLAADFKNGFYKLIDLLIEQARYLEAYETSERIKMLDQRRVPIEREITLSDSEANKTFQEAKRLRAEMAGLQLLQDSLAFLPRADREARQPFIARSLGEKQGRLYEQLESLKARNPNYAALFQPKAMTLQSLQETLPEGTAVAEVFHADSLATTIFITKTSVDVMRSAITKVELEKSLAQLRRNFFTNDRPNAAALKQDAAQRRLTEVFYQPLEPKLAAPLRLQKIIFVSSLGVPFHILGGESFLIEQIDVSYLTSTMQLELSKNVTRPRTLDFTGLSETRVVEPKFFETVKESVLLFSDFTADELTEYRIAFELALKDPGVSLSKSLKFYAKQQAAKGETDWIYFCGYGN